MTENMEFPPELGRLSAIARTRLFPGETNLHALPNLSAACGGGANLYVKRDDCTELAFGGNKVRQLEFYMGQACAEGADTILITGAVQSNFVRLAAAAACRLGMACHIQLEERVPKDNVDYRGNGNVLLDKIFGATLYSYPDGEDEEGADRRLTGIADDLRARGRNPYIIPLGPGHAPLGALGYVVAAHELLQQIDRMGLTIDEIFIGSGSGNTHGGMLFGLRALGSPIMVTGVCVRRDAARQTPRIAKRCREIADLLQVACKVTDDDVTLVDDFLAPGYGLADATCMRAILLAARTEGLLLDPIYSGKAMAAIIDRATNTTEKKNLLLLHTGGAPAVFGYKDELVEAMTEMELAAGSA